MTLQENLASEFIEWLGGPFDSRTIAAMSFDFPLVPVTTLLAMSVETAMARYYAQRAPQYERIYHKPERQSDLRRLRQMVEGTLAGKRILEIACGTGYWTEIVSHVSASMVALDCNGEVLALARAKLVAPGKVTFLQGDAHDLPELERGFDAGLAGFWWSHVPKARLASFLRGFHCALEPGAVVMFFDNAYVAGNSTPLSRKDSDGNPVSQPDEDGNTYQERVLDDGSMHQVVKNFPTAQELREALDGLAVEVNITFLTYYWILTYHLPKSATHAGGRPTVEAGI